MVGLYQNIVQSTEVYCSGCMHFNGYYAMFYVGLCVLVLWARIIAMVISYLVISFVCFLSIVFIYLSNVVTVGMNKSKNRNEH